MMHLVFLRFGEMKIGLTLKQSNILSVYCYKISAKSDNGLNATIYSIVIVSYCTIKCDRNWHIGIHVPAFVLLVFVRLT